MSRLRIPIRILLVLVMLLSLVAAVVACGEEEAEEVTPLKIGQLNSFTGDLSDFGATHRDAAQLAIDHVNQAGGVQGELVQLVARDTATNPVVGVDAAKALVNVDNAVAIVGALSSGVSIAVANSVTIPAGVLQISAASTNPGITVLEDNDFMFRTTVGDAAQGKVLGRLAVDVGYETASVIHVNNAYGAGLAEAFGSLSLICFGIGMARAHKHPTLKQYVVL